MSQNSNQPDRRSPSSGARQARPPEQTSAEHSCSLAEVWATPPPGLLWPDHPDLNATQVTCDACREERATWQRRTPDGPFLPPSRGWTPPPPLPTFPPSGHERVEHPAIPVHTCELDESWWGDGSDEDERLQEVCFACQVERDRAAVIARWEGEPLDPDQDLSWLEDYPGELDHLRAQQEAIRHHPVYRVADMIGSRARRDCLRVFALGTQEPDEFFEQELCACEGRDVDIVGQRGHLHRVTLWDTHVDGTPLTRRERRARRCRWCVVKEALERAAFIELRTQISGRPREVIEAETGEAERAYRKHGRGRVA